MKLIALVLLVVMSLIAFSCSRTEPCLVTPTATNAPTASGPPPKMTTDVMCIQMSKDGSELFYDHGPCTGGSPAGAGPGATGGGTPLTTPATIACQSQLKAALSGCKGTQDSTKQKECSADAHAAYASCVVRAVNITNAEDTMMQ